MRTVLITIALLVSLFSLFGCDAPDRAAPHAATAVTATAAVTAAITATTAAATAAPSITPRPPGKPIRVGVTLHPYYSWTKSIVGDTPGVEVVPVLPGDVDAGNYQPRAEDIAKIGTLDAIVINGIGHDDFITSMIQASKNPDIVVIRPNEATPLIKSAHGGSVNSHTFISFTNAITQTYAIERALAALRPDLAPRFADGAGRYTAKLRRIRMDAAQKLAGARIKRVVTVHDGYGYLCQEFGIEVAGVVEPAHGLIPSAAELGDMIHLIKREDIKVVLSEEGFPDKLLKVLKTSAPVNVYVITHIASGPYTEDKFEREMTRNADTLIKALTGA